MGHPENVWRKSYHWMALTRQVADVVVHEGAMDNAYERECGPCNSDEHYVPVLLALHNLSDWTSCVESTTYQDWTQFSFTVPRLLTVLLHAHICQQGSPRNFTPSELNATFIQHARTVHCPVDHWQAVADAQAALVSLHDVVRTGGVLFSATGHHRARLRPECYLFLRKVVLVKNAEDPVHALQLSLATEGGLSEPDVQRLMLYINRP